MRFREFLYAPMALDRLMVRYLRLDRGSINVMCIIIRDVNAS